MTITASDARRCGFLPPRRRRGACCCYPPLVLGAALVMEKQACIGEDLKAKGLMKG
jgi:hypothetical protein